jgi:N-acetylated-alpha-linked acidic dipeptidase
MEDPGGGSDFAGFYNHLGIPHTDWGFGGPYGVYHSAYDSYAWMDRWGDTSFVYHAAAARLGAALALRLANADVIPYDYAEFARTRRGYLPALDSVAQAKTWKPMAAPLGAAIGRMAGAAEAFATARDAALSKSPPDRETLRRTNAALLRVERALTRPEGLRTRPWFRSLIYAADEDNGYANVVFPTIREAIRDDDRELAQREVADLAERFDAATRALEDARRALVGR